MSDPIQASFTLQVWARERWCVVCGKPGTNAHHVLYGSWSGRRENVLANGVMLCGSGTTGCHGKFHDGDKGVAKAIGVYIRDHRPDTLSYLATKLGTMEAIDYVYRRYFTEVQMDAPHEAPETDEVPRPRLTEFQSLVTGAVAGALFAAGSKEGGLLIDSEVEMDKDGNYTNKILVTGRESGEELLVTVEPFGPQPDQVDAAQVVIYEDAAGEFRWTAMDTNNTKVADSGEGYKSRSYAEKAATDLFPNAKIRPESDED